MELQQLSPAEVIGDRRGKIAAVIGLILFLVVILIPIFFKLNPPPGQPGIAVLLAFDDQGSGDDPAGPASPAPPTPEPTPTPPPPTPEPQPEPEVKPPPPAPAPRPQPEVRDVIQTETPQEIAIRKRKAREAAERAEAERRERAAEQAAREQAERDRREREAREAAIREAEAKAERERQAREARAAALRDQLSGGLSGSGGGSGNTNQPGTQGRPDGVPDGSSISSGSGRVTGLGGRDLVASPPVRERSQTSGTVIVEVCIGPDGAVKTAKFIQANSTTQDSGLISAAIANAKTWKFSASPTAPPTQCGKITYTFRVQ